MHYIHASVTVRYKIERKAVTGQKYAFAIAALPRYPPPDLLEEKTKIALIFDVFDRDHDGFLNEIEFCLWQSILKKPEADDDAWETTLQLYQEDHGCNPDPFKGFRVRELSTFYSKADDTALDEDYKRLFPVLAEGEADDAASSSDNGSSEQSHSVDDDESDSEDDAASESSSTTDAEAEGEEDGAEVDQEEDRIEEELRVNPNARKLQFIFNYVTREHRGWKVDALVSSVHFLAAKITSSQLELLKPILGEESVCGMARVATHALVTQKRTPALLMASSEPTAMVMTTSHSESLVPAAQGDSTSSAEGSLDLYVRTLHELVVSEIYQSFNALFVQMFDPTLVRDGVANFYDNVIVDKIQAKANRLLSENIKVTEADVDPTTYEEFLVLPPKTGEEMTSFVRNYCVEHDAEIRRHLLLGSQAGTLQLDFYVSCIVEILLAAQVLDEAEAQRQTVCVATVEGHLMEVALWMPTNKSCYQVLAKAVQSSIGQGSDLIEDSIQAVCTNFLWFDAFRILVCLLGVSLTHDELPGCALDDGDDATPHGPHPVEETALAKAPGYRQSNRKNAKRLDESAIGALAHLGAEVAEAQLRLQRRRFQRNKERMRRVFDQLSNHSSFLPVDLADEAILLLTDNRMNFCATVACLQHLRIHSTTIMHNTSPTQALLSLGILLDSPVCDLTASTEEQPEKFDWTGYRRNSGWDDTLTDVYHRLAWSTPGFMGKSQMIEFIREIHKMFSPATASLDRSASVETGMRPEGGRAFVPFQTQRDLISTPGGHQTEEGGGLLAVEGGGPAMTAPHDAASFVGSVVSFEMFHRIAMRNHYSLSRRHSRILWILMCIQVARAEGTEEIVQEFLPIMDVCRLLPDMYLQGQDYNGLPVPHNRPLADICRYKGYLTQFLFRRLVRRMGIDLPEAGLKAIWEDLQKDPMDITEYLPDALLLPALEVENAVQTKFLRLETDNLGLDPTRGRVVALSTFRSRIARILMGGLWPECIKVLMKLSLQVECSDAQLQTVLEKVNRRTNRHGLARPDEIANIMTSLNVEGMSYSMLKKIIERMQLNMAPHFVRQMFNLMDVNHDGSLDLGELIGGFQVLFNRLLPLQVISAVKLSQENQLAAICTVLCALLVFFGFIGIAFSSFVVSQRNRHLSVL